MLRLLSNLERVNEDTTDNLLGEKFGYIVSYQLYGIWRRIKIQKRMISINWCIAALTFVLFILIISDSIVLDPLPSIPTILLGSHGLNISFRWCYFRINFFLHLMVVINFLLVTVKLMLSFGVFSLAIVWYILKELI